MASKRHIIVKTPEEEEEPEEVEVGDRRSDREIAISGTWQEWFFRVYLRYMYAMVVLFTACVIPLEMTRSLEGSLGIVCAFFSLLVIVSVSIWAYFRLWGDCGRWGGGPSC